MGNLSFTVRIFLFSAIIFMSIAAGLWERVTLFHLIVTFVFYWYVFDDESSTPFDENPDMSVAVSRWDGWEGFDIGVGDGF